MESEILARVIAADQIRDRADALESELLRALIARLGESTWTRLARNNETLNLV